MADRGHRHLLRWTALALALGCGSAAHVVPDAGAGGTSGGGSSGSGSEASAAGDAGGDAATQGDGGPVPSTMGAVCVPSTRHALSQPCAVGPGGSPLVSFECVPFCGEFAIIGAGDAGFVQCAFSFANDGRAPTTDAGTIVLCCPVEPGQFDSGTGCEGPFM